MEQKRILLAMAHLDCADKITQYVLENAGCVVHITRSVAEAWQRVQAEKYHIIIAYVFLDGGYGYDLLDKIREDASLADLPFLLLENYRNTYISNLPAPPLNLPQAGLYRQDKDYWVMRVPFNPTNFAEHVTRIISASNQTINKNEI